MVHDLYQTSQPSTVADNRFQEFQSSTMTTNIFHTSKSLSFPVPRLIVYRYFTIDSVLDSRPSFSWSSFGEEVSNYIVQLSGSKGIFWQKEVDKTTEPYDGEIILQPGENYFFTVEIDRQYSCVNSHGKKEVNIAEDVKKGIRQIEKTGLSRQFVTSIIAQLDGLLIARNEILDIIRGVTRQGSNSEIICFLADFLNQASVFKLLAEARSSDDILDTLGEIASQLAAANITLGDYLRLSGVQKSLAESLVSKGLDLAFFAQNLQKTFQLGKFSRSSLLSSCLPECETYLDDICRNPSCSGCSRCL